MLNRWLACTRSSNTNRFSWWLTHFTSADAVHDDAFKPNIKYSNITYFINSTILDFAVTTYHYTQHGCCKLLANGKRILHMECCHSFTPILASRPRSSHPWQSYRISLYHIFLFTIKSYTLSAIWQNTIWLLCDDTECSLWPTIITSRWRLWKQFRYYWLTHSTKKDTKNAPYFQHWTCFIWSRTCHTMKHATSSTQTSMQMTIIQFNRWWHSTHS